MKKENTVSNPCIHWTLALIPLAVLVALQVLVIREFGSDALDGAAVGGIPVAAGAFPVAADDINHGVFSHTPWSN